MLSSMGLKECVPLLPGNDSFSFVPEKKDDERRRLGGVDGKEVRLAGLKTVRDNSSVELNGTRVRGGKIDGKGRVFQRSLEFDFA